MDAGAVTVARGALGLFFQHSGDLGLRTVVGKGGRTYLVLDLRQVLDDVVDSGLEHGARAVAMLDDVDWAWRELVPLHPQETAHLLPKEGRRLGDTKEAFFFVVQNPVFTQAAQKLDVAMVLPSLVCPPAQPRVDGHLELPKCGLLEDPGLFQRAFLFHCHQHLGIA